MLEDFNISHSHTISCYLKKAVFDVFNISESNIISVEGAKVV
jgi:hypothetical protein